MILSHIPNFIKKKSLHKNVLSNNKAETIFKSYIETFSILKAKLSSLNKRHVNFF